MKMVQYLVTNGEWYFSWDESVEYEYQARTTNVYVQRTNSQIEMHSSGDNFIYGPFTYEGAGIETSYSYEVYDHSGNVISGVSSTGNLSNRRK